MLRFYLQLRLYTCCRMHMKTIKILYFFPYTIVNKNHGNVTRAIQLLQYFESRKNRINVDFVTVEDKNIENEPALLRQMFPELNAFFLERKYSKKNYLKYIFKYKIASLVDKKKQSRYHVYFKSPVTLFEKQTFNSLLKTTQYDAIIISYIYIAYQARCVDNCLYT